MMTSVFLKLPSACCTARHLDDRLHPRAQSCRLLERATPPPAPQTTRATKDAQLPPCCFFQYPFSAPRPPLPVAAISPESPLSSASRVPAGPRPATGLPARRSAPRPPPAPTRVSSFTPPGISHPTIFFLPPSFHRPPSGRGRAPRPPPAVGHPAVVVFPPARHQPPRGRGRAPRPPLATPWSSASPPPALGRPAVVVAPPARRRPPRGRWLSPWRPSAAPRCFACPPPAAGDPTGFGLPPALRLSPRRRWPASRLRSANLRISSSAVCLRVGGDSPLRRPWRSPFFENGGHHAASAAAMGPFFGGGVFGS